MNLISDNISSYVTSKGKINYYLIILFLIPFVLTFNGYVASSYWNWFIVPILNLNPINIALGIALLLFYRLISYKKSNEPIKKSNPSIKQYLIDNLAPGIVFYFFGWILTFFI